MPKKGFSVTNANAAKEYYSYLRGIVATLPSSPYALWKLAESDRVR
nr:MAG TPA: hypothetical protein [Caudoviricetes sp.]